MVRTSPLTATVLFLVHHIPNGEQRTAAEIAQKEKIAKERLAQEAGTVTKEAVATKEDELTVAGSRIGDIYERIFIPF